MKYKPLLFTILLVLLVWLQLAVTGGLYLSSGKLNIILAALVILINLTDFSWALIFAVAGGLLLDVYSGLPFGVLTLCLFATAVVVEVLFLNFFTNFSFYSLLLLGLIASTAYNAMLIAVIAGIYFMGLSDFLPRWDYLPKFLWQVATMEIIMTAAYFIINKLSRRFKPMFIN